MTNPQPKPRAGGWEKRFNEIGFGNQARIVGVKRVELIDFIRSLLSRREREVREVEKKYHELILAVGNKFEGETRHQTALRYIREAEKSICVGQEKMKDQAIEAVKGGRCSF